MHLNYKRAYDSFCIRSLPTTHSIIRCYLCFVRLFTIFSCFLASCQETDKNALELWKSNSFLRAYDSLPFAFREIENKIKMRKLCAELQMRPIYIYYIYQISRALSSLEAVQTYSQFTYSFLLRLPPAHISKENLLALNLIFVLFTFKT